MQLVVLQFPDLCIPELLRPCSSVPPDLPGGPYELQTLTIKKSFHCCKVSSVRNIWVKSQQKFLRKSLIPNVVSSGWVCGTYQTIWSCIFFIRACLGVHLLGSTFGEIVVSRHSHFLYSDYLATQNSGAGPAMWLSCGREPVRHLRLHPDHWVKICILRTIPRWFVHTC